LVGRAPLAAVRTGGAPEGARDAALASLGIVHPAATDPIERRLDRLAKQRFRAKFHLSARDRATVELRGIETIRRHAHDLIAKRLAPAEPYKDGKQTPYRGHPVFVAQHATATCCRTCLQRNHEIPKGRELSPGQHEYVVDVICRWIEREHAVP
jgi:hypothetical protein